ncbi:hypothetical protein FQR65_LT17921 [Abscondita terminalis]|nr:hypothetical protein FQR65_LT17921 [Abscondita terminalis]
MAPTKFVWSLAATKTLICEYESYEFLYNVPHEDYKNRNKRLDEYQEISNVIGNGCTAVDIKKKLNGLRRQYLAEKQKKKYDVEDDEVDDGNEEIYEHIEEEE